MSGLMGAWWRTRFLVLLRQVRGVLLVVLVIFGPIVGGAVLMMILVVTWPLSLAVVMVLFWPFSVCSKG